MALRIPPGRAGRLWLLARIETARRAGELLEKKRAVLLAAERDAATRAASTGASWREKARAAERLLRQTLVLDGERALTLAAAHAGKAESRVTWRSAMGLRYPLGAEVTLPAPPDPALLAGGTSLVLALAAHREAVDAAAAFAAARTAHDRLAAELRATIRRLRAIEVRWLPQHERALAELDVALDEAERAEVARVRWVAGRLGRRGA
jgi:V/A-type H+-transporting ATPase subunit D